MLSNQHPDEGRALSSANTAKLTAQLTPRVEG